MPRTINCKCTPEYPFKVQVRSSPASRASLWPAARLVDALQDRPILYLAGHSLSDRMRTPVPVGRNTARGRERGRVRKVQRKSYFETQKNISRVNNSGKRSVCLQNTSEQRAPAPCRARKGGNHPRSHIQDAAVFPRGFTVAPPFCFDTPLWCLHAFNQPRDSQECIVGCIYTAVAPSINTHPSAFGSRRR